MFSASGMGKTSTIFLESLFHQKYQIYFDESLFLSLFAWIPRSLSIIKIKKLPFLNLNLKKNT